MTASNIFLHFDSRRKENQKVILFIIKGSRIPTPRFIDVLIITGILRPKILTKFFLLLIKIILKIAIIVCFAT